MLYRILALFALFFFTACGGGTGMQPQTGMGEKRDPSGQYADTWRYGQTQPGVEAVDGAPVPAAPLKVVKIGLLAPLTGPASDVGTALMDAATLALMDKYGYTNEEELLVKVILVPKDTKGTPEGAKEAASHVLSAGAQMIVGPLFSQNVTAIAPIARQQGVNILTFSNNPEVAGHGVFVFGFQVDQQVKRIVNYALNHNLDSMALLRPNSPYGNSVQQAMTQVLGDSGLGLAAEAYYNPAASAGAEAEKIAAAYGQSLFNALLLPEGGEKLQSMVRLLRERGVAAPNVRLLGTGLWDEPSILRSGMLTGGWFVSSPPERFAAYERRFRDYFGYAPPRISALAYDAVALAASLAMADHDANFSIDAITDPVGYNGPVNGVFRCHTNGICERGLAVLEVTSRGARVIDPAPAAFNY